MTDKTPNHLIDGRIQELGDRRGAALARFRELITQAVFNPGLEGNAR